MDLYGTYTRVDNVLSETFWIPHNRVYVNRLRLYVFEKDNIFFKLIT